MAAWLKAIGRSDTTGWRYVKAGWLHPVNIAGRLYLTPEDIERFQRRAVAGEFARNPAGAARKAAAARQARESEGAQ
jgi:hypothetical protein